MTNDEPTVTEQSSRESVGRAASFFEWVSGHIKWITIGIMVLTVVAALVATGRSEDDPNFDPSGEIYDTFDLVADNFQSASPLPTRCSSSTRRTAGTR